MPAQKDAFAPGNKVRLNIGGPVMVVKYKSPLGDGNITCQWFVGKKLEEGQFAVETLVAVTDEEANAAAAPAKKKAE